MNLQYDEVYENKLRVTRRGNNFPEGAGRPKVRDKEANKPPRMTGSFHKTVKKNTEFSRPDKSAHE